MGNSQVVIKPPEPLAAKKICSLPETVEHPRARQVLEFLKHDMIGTVAIWGMGGVGKTYILQQIYNHPSIAAAGFDLVIWWPFNHSQKQQPDTKAIQVELAKLLGLTFPNYPTHYATRIYDFLNPKKFLLLIDGLWSWIDLKDIGVPHAKFGDCRINPNHKVIFTTRVNSVYFGMAPSFKIRIDPLDWKASWLLFQKTFGEQVLCTNPFLQIRAVKVVEKCVGLPLALITAARAMSSMEWEEVMSMPEILHLRDICGLLQLRYLNLSRTTIESLPEEIGSLSALEYLILSETHHLRSIPHGLILKLKNLLLLDLYASRYVIAVDDIWERSKMRLWTTLGATITTASDLQRLYGDNNVRLWRLWMKDLEGTTSLNLLEIFVQTKLIKRYASLSEFTLSSCTSLEEFVMTDESLFGKIGFQNLEEFIMAEANPFMMHGFQNVEVLTLLDLPKLERVSVGNWPYFIIRSLTISSCSKLKNFNWIMELKNLEHLSLESCYGMEQVINDNAVGNRKSLFYKLTSLSLRDLPNLEFICSYAHVLPRLEDFRVIACPKLKRLPVSFEIVNKKFFGIQIKGSEQWWEDLVWEAYSIKSLLRPYFKADAA